MAERNWYTYYFKVDNTIVHRGITQDLARRETEHQQTWPSGHIVQIGGLKTEQEAKGIGKRNKALANQRLDMMFRQTCLFLC